MTTELPVADLGIDLHSVPPGELITLIEATQLFRGRYNGHIHLQVLQRYCAKGKVLNGVRVRIPTIIQAGRRWTTEAAVRAWQRKCDELTQMQPEVIQHATPCQRMRAHERSASRLRKQGMRS